VRFTADTLPSTCGKGKYLIWWCPDEVGREAIILSPRGCGIASVTKRRSLTAYPGRAGSLGPPGPSLPVPTPHKLAFPPSDPPNSTVDVVPCTADPPDSNYGAGRYRQRRINRTRALPPGLRMISPCLGSAGALSRLSTRVREEGKNRNQPCTTSAHHGALLLFAQGVGERC